MRKSSLSLITLIPAFLAALGCARTAEPIYIGSAGPWNEISGRMMQRGVRFAVEEINAAGGIAGRPLQVIERDDSGDGTQAAAIASEFVTNSAILGVVGHVTSGAMMAAAPIYDQGLAAIATSASSPDLSGISEWTFRVIPSDSVNGLMLARFATERGFRRAAILYENNSYGRGLAAAFSDAFRGSIVSRDPIPSGDSGSVEPFVSWIRTRDADLVFVASTNQSGRRVLREARRQGLSAAFMGGDGWTSVARDTALAEGVWVGAPFSARDPRPEAQQFVKSFVARYDEEPDANAALAYDATRILARAIERAGASRSRVRDWIAGLRETQPYQGVTGPISFRADGDLMSRGITMTRIRSGALVPVSNGASP